MVNVATLCGVIVSEISTTKLPSGASVMRFRLQTTDSIEVNGEIVARSTTHLIDVWGRSIQKQIASSLKSRDTIFLSGTIRSRKVSKAGEPDRWTTSIEVRDGHTVTILPTTAGAAPNLGKDAEQPKAAAKAPAEPKPPEQSKYEPLPPLELDDHKYYF